MQCSTYPSNAAPTLDKCEWKITMGRLVGMTKDKYRIQVCLLAYNSYCLLMSHLSSVGAAFDGYVHCTALFAPSFSLTTALCFTTGCLFVSSLVITTLRHVLAFQSHSFQSICRRSRTVAGAALGIRVEHLGGNPLEFKSKENG